MRRRPPSLRRILFDFAVLIVVHLVLVQILGRVHLLEHMLSPGPGSALALAVTVFFLVVRTILLLLAPGLFLARVWLRITAVSGE